MSKDQKILNEIILKAWEDDTFKQSLIQDPIKTIEETFNKKLKLPEGKNLVVKDQTSGEVVYINIPQKLKNVELTEEQLEAVAGGVHGPEGCTPSPFPIPILEDWFV